MRAAIMEKQLTNGSKVYEVCLTISDHMYAGNFLFLAFRCRSKEDAIQLSNNIEKCTIVYQQ